MWWYGTGTWQGAGTGQGDVAAWWRGAGDIAALRGGLAVGEGWHVVATRGQDRSPLELPAAVSIGVGRETVAEGH